ncbi:uncharacterized protein [Asterias amurensis]|uniref:uncharacterized protein isoform X2 n=1 Tax=Asterias amurensis TaxID=7602 RepID=UPI003AB49E72
MAASVDSLKQQQFAKSAFGIPLKSSTFSRIQPPALHRISYLTGGLAELYEHIQNPNEEYNPNAVEASCFTDEKGAFCPTKQVPLLAKRYHFIRILGKGCSATLIEAVDTFRPDSHHVAIKVLNEEYYALGYQESNNVERLNCADPQDFSGTVRLLNKFTFGNHFCLVFELLHPKPLHQYFKPISQGPKKLELVRKVALRLLQVLGFLQQENVIHADLKPENILCRSEDLSAGVKVIDFGNAIHCVYDELSLYYDDFELQTLLYRAPEVVFGLPFGPEIDVWSVGCILAELYLGEPLFFAVTKDELLDKMVTSLGPLPIHIFQRGKFYSEYQRYIGKPQSMLETQSKLFSRLTGLRDYNFGSFILAFLQYNPSDRISVSDAFLHPFLAPEVAARYLMPSASKASMYHRIDIPAKTYNLSPTICSEVAADRLSSLDLLRRGTAVSQSDSLPAKKPKRAIAEVAPFASKPDVEGLCSSPSVVPVPVSVGVSSEENTFELAGGVLKQESLDTDGIIKHSQVTKTPRDSNGKNTDILKDFKRKNIQRDCKRNIANGRDIANIPIDSNRKNDNLPQSSSRTTPKTSIPVLSSVANSSEDQSSRHCKRQIPFSSKSVKRETNLESHPDRSAQDIMTVNQKRKDPNDDGNKELSNNNQDIQIEVAHPVAKQDSRKNLSVFQSILKRELKIRIKQQHNANKTEMRSCQTRQKHSECQRSPQTSSLEKRDAVSRQDSVTTCFSLTSQSQTQKHATVSRQDSVATSSSLTSSPQTHVDGSKDREEDTQGRGQRSMNEQQLGTRMSRFKHLEKMKMDAVQQNSQGALELRDEPKALPGNKSGSPRVFLDSKKEMAEEQGNISETSERHSGEKGHLLLTPSSNPLEVSNDGLILLTPLSSAQQEESPKPQSENRVFKATCTSMQTPRIKHERVRDRIPNKQRISLLFGAKKADKGDTLPEVMIHSRSDENKTGQSQINERRCDVGEIFSTPTKNDFGSKSEGNLLRAREKNGNNGGTPGRVTNNVNSVATLTSSTPVGVGQKRSGRCSVQSLSTIRCADIEDRVDDKAHQRRSTDVKFTPRSSSRRSKSLAQERIKAKNFHQGDNWWKLSSREGRWRGEEEVSLEDAEDGGDEAGMSSAGEVPLAREEVGKQLADIKDEGGSSDCSAHQERRTPSKNLFSRTLSRMSPARSDPSCVKATEGMSTAHLRKTPAEDVYNFESSPNSKGHTALLSKKRRVHADQKASLKSKRTSQKDIQKKLLKTQSHKRRKSTSSETKVKNPTEGISTAHTDRTLAEDVYNFESSPNLKGHTALFSKKPRTPADHRASLKSKRTSQKDIQKKFPKTQSHKRRTSTKSETKVKNPRLLKRKMSGILIADLQFTSKSGDTDFPDESKHELTINPMRTLDDGENVTEVEIKTIQGLEEISHMKRRKIKPDWVTNSRVGQYQKIPDDWESCFRSVAQAPLPPDKPVMLESSDNTLSERQSGTEHEQNLSEDDSDGEWCDSEWDPETSLSGGISSQTPTTGNFDDDDDDVMLL